MAALAWDGGSLDLDGDNASDGIKTNLEQSGSILRTITGLGVVNVVWSKWVLSFSWNQAPEEVATALRAMKADGGDIAFTDTIIGNYTLGLTDDDLLIEDTAFGMVNASAVFREV